MKEKTPEDLIVEVLNKPNASAHAKLAELVGKVEWSKPDPWYPSRYYDLLVHSIKHDAVDLFDQLAKQVKTNPRLLLDPSIDCLFSQGGRATSKLMDKMVSSGAKGVWERALSLWPEALPSVGMYVFRKSGKMDFLPMFEYLFLHRQKVYGESGNWPETHARSLLHAAIHENVKKARKMLLPVFMKDRNRSRFSMMLAIGIEDWTLVRELISVHGAFLADALVDCRENDKLFNRAQAQKCDELAMILSERDAMAVDLLCGDELPLPAIRARVQEMLLGLATPAATQPSRPRRRV